MVNAVNNQLALLAGNGSETRRETTTIQAEESMLDFNDALSQDEAHRLDFNDAPSQGAISQSPPAAVTTTDHTGSFAAAMAEYGLVPPFIELGSLERFDGQSKKSAWYTFQQVGRHGFGWFGDWAGIPSVKWTSVDACQLTPDQAVQYQQDMAEAEAGRKAAKLKMHIESRAEAQALWRNATPTIGHPYLTKKGIQPHGLRVSGDVLLVPMVDFNGEIWSVQRIYPDGSKWFFGGGRVKGLAYTLIGNDIYVVCEGYATGASIHEATGATVLVAYNSGNLAAVCKTLRQQRPTASIIVAADNDKWKTRPDGQATNPGIAYATSAAQAIGARVIVPEFKDTTTKPTDFNDLAALEGLSTVSALFGNISKYKRATKTVSFEDFSAMECEFDPIIKGLFNAGDNVLIHSAGGVGKSLFTTYLAAAMGGASPDGSTCVLDQFDVPKPRASLIIQAENTLTAMSVRTRRMSRSGPTVKRGLSNVFSYCVGDDICVSGESIEDPEFRIWLKALIKQIKIDHGVQIECLIIDPLISYHDSDENDNKAMRAALDLLTKLCAEAEVTPIVVHHDNKNGDFRGATAIHDWARSRIQLKEEEHKGVRSIGAYHHKASNGVKFDPFFLRFDDNFIPQAIRDTEMQEAANGLALELEVSSTQYCKNELLRSPDCKVIRQSVCEGGGRGAMANLIEYTIRAGLIKVEKQGVGGQTKHVLISTGSRFKI